MLSLLKKHSILYVEDEPEIQAQIKEYLESYFKIVYVASDGCDALRLYQEYRPDVLLLDINLPFFDGLSVAKEVRKSDENVKIVMLTAHTEKEKLLVATELKLTKYLIKPISPQDFKETLKILAIELLNNPSKFIQLGDNSIWDREQKSLIVDNRAVSLSQKELALLEFFIKNRGKTIGYEDIMVNVWEDSFDREISIDSIKNLVSSLRKRLSSSSISNVYGKGYIFK